MQLARVAAAVPFLVMAVGDVQRWAQIGDGREHLVSINRMFAHHYPLFIAQRTRLAQDFVWHAHLADVVQEGAAADVHQFGLAYFHGARQFHGHLGDALGMAFGLLVT